VTGSSTGIASTSLKANVDTREKFQVGLGEVIERDFAC